MTEDLVSLIKQHVQAALTAVGGGSLQPPHNPIIAKKPVRPRIKTPLKARNVARPQNLARHRLIPVQPIDVKPKSS